MYTIGIKISVSKKLVFIFFYIDMKKVLGLLFISVASVLLLTWCFERDNVDSSVTVENDDFWNKFLTAFWTEPFWDLEISWWIAKFSSPIYDTNVEIPVSIRKEWENFYFSWEELEWEFIKKDCIDWWKWDMHYYTVWVAKFRDYYYEGCWDDEEGIKMSDEEVSADFYEPVEESITQDIVEKRIENWFKDISECMQTLDQYEPEWMPWDPQTTITVSCWPELYWDIYITWFIYTSAQPDLWLRVTSPKGYHTFYVKSEKPIFIRNWNKLSYSDDSEYIEVFEKSEDEDLYKIITEKHLNKGCYAYEYEWEQNKVWWHNGKIYDIEDNNRNIWWECIADDNSKEQDYKVVRYFESPDKTKYYKLVFHDWCAPWPCSMFWDVEIF